MSTRRNHSARVYPEAGAYAWTWVAWGAALFVGGVLLVLLNGCTPGRSYVEADRLTYEAVAPEYLGYVEEDPGLSGEQRERRRETVRSWEARLEQAEGGDRVTVADGDWVSRGSDEGGE